MAALRTARRLVRVDAHAIELVRWDAVGDGQQRAGVIGGRDPVRRVRTAVEPALVMHCRDLAVLLHAGADAHLHRVPAAVCVEDLFSVERDLHRSPRAHRKQRGRELVAERIALAAERAAVRGRDHADARPGQAEHLFELAVQVVGDLRRGPEGQLVIGAVRGDGAVRLDRRMRVAFEEEPVVAHVVRGRETAFEVAE